MTCRTQASNQAPACITAYKMAMQALYQRDIPGDQGCDVVGIASVLTCFVVGFPETGSGRCRSWKHKQSLRHVPRKQAVMGVLVCYHHRACAASCSSHFYLSETALEIKLWWGSRRVLAALAAADLRARAAIGLLAQEIDKLRFRLDRTGNGVGLSVHLQRAGGDHTRGLFRGIFAVIKLW